MKVAIASDHRGFHLKEKVISLLKSKGHTVIDDGPASEASVDYPDFAALVAKKVSSGEVERGILICGTGIGMAISANKFPGVRAAACADEVTAELSRRHETIGTLARGIAEERLRRSREETVDTIWAVGSSEVFLLLRIGRGWTADQYLDWLTRTLTHLVLT